MKFEFNVNLKKKKQTTAHKEPNIEKEPPLRISLTLAYQLQRFFDKGNASTLKQASDWLNMSYSRISQIMNLLFLAPAIQEEILLSGSNAIQNLTEYGIRNISTEAIWEKQEKLWRKLIHKA